MCVVWLLVALVLFSTVWLFALCRAAKYAEDAEEGENE